VAQRIKGLGDSTWRFSHPFNHAIAWLKGWGGERKRGGEKRLGRMERARAEAAAAKTSRGKEAKRNGA